MRCKTFLPVLINFTRTVEILDVITKNVPHVFELIFVVINDVHYIILLWKKLCMPDRRIIYPFRGSDSYFKYRSKRLMHDMRPFHKWSSYTCQIKLPNFIDDKIKSHLIEIIYKISGLKVLHTACKALRTTFRIFTTLDTSVIHYKMEQWAFEQYYLHYLHVWVKKLNRG